MKKIIIALCVLLVVLIVLYLSLNWTEKYFSISKSTGGGIRGKVTLVTGNCMPTTKPGVNSCKYTNVSRKIYIRKATTMQALDSDLIKTIDSGKDGFYKTDLPAGKYSVFVENEGKEYCNRFGGMEEACQVEVGDGFIEHNIEIDAAVW